MKKISLFDIPDADERGVSPVIGVILMVAITVILAAVIATFVLGFPDQVNDNVNAGVDVSVDDGSADVTWISQGNAEKLNVTVNGASSQEISNVGGVLTVGNDSSYDFNVAPGSTTIVVTGIKGDTTTVVQKETVNITN